MGLIKRSGLKAIIIKTKIGEKAVTEGAIIPPFYREDFDWEYASEILEASRKEKLKFERSWIIKYSKGATSLLTFKKNIDEALEKPKLRELDKSVLITLQAYLEKILPELQYAPLSKTLDVRDGINIMDLERFKEETQGLIIISVLNEVLLREKGVIVIIPEAWKYLPEKYASPVKRPAESYVRQGATNDNYLWQDSQDITGTSKVILKQVSNWVLGKQTEINELKRSLDQIPLPKKMKPKPEDVANLKLGEFYVVTSEGVKKTYVQPSWLDDKTAKKVSLGEIDVHDLIQPTHIAPYEILQKEQPIETSATYKPSVDSKKIINELRDDFISNRNDFFTKFQQINDTISSIQAEIFKKSNEIKPIDEDEIVARVLQKVPTTAITSPSAPAQINEEALISKILARVPSGGSVVYEVAPLEKIKKDFLEESKAKILSDINTLGDDAKKMLKYLESMGRGVKVTELINKCFLLKEGGSQRKKVSSASLELRGIETERVDTSGTHFGTLKNRIKFLLETKEATESEINQVYDHILMEMLG